MPHSVSITSSILMRCPQKIQKGKKDILKSIADEQGLSVSRMFINAVEEKYNIKLLGDKDQLT